MAQNVVLTGAPGQRRGNPDDTDQSLGRKYGVQTPAQTAAYTVEE